MKSKNRGQYNPQVNPTKEPEFKPSLRYVPLCLFRLNFNPTDKSKSPLLNPKMRTTTNVKWEAPRTLEIVVILLYKEKRANLSNPLEVLEEWDQSSLYTQLTLNF